MERKIQAPTVTRVDPVHGTDYEHPAFGYISASRMSGSPGAVLFGSDFRHHNFVEVVIGPATSHRGLSSDRHFDKGEFVRVRMSEAQWAHFVSSMNVGSGSQCTVQHVGGEYRAELPPPEAKRDTFAREMDEHMATAHAQLQQAADKVRASGLSAAKQREILGALEQAGMNIGCNAEFVAKQFGEHMEGTVEKAKAEVNAYALNALRDAGIRALAGPAPADNTAGIIDFKPGESNG